MWQSLFGGRGGQRDNARESIVELRQHILVLEKKEEFLTKKIADEQRKAKDSALSNKRLATAALRQKKQYETELEKIGQRRFNMEQQVMAIESAHLNLETLQAMSKGASALKGIHGKMDVDAVDNTMDQIREQMELTNEISEAISTTTLGAAVDEQDLQDELAQLEQDELSSRIRGPAQPQTETAPSALESAPRVPTAEPTHAPEPVPEDDDEAQLRALQADLGV